MIYVILLLVIIMCIILNVNTSSNNEAFTNKPQKIKQQIRNYYRIIDCHFTNLYSNVYSKFHHKFIKFIK